MSPVVSEIFLRNVETGKLTRAQLHDEILPRHLDDCEKLWQSIQESESVEHAHWNWRRKMSRYGMELTYESIAVECEGIAQGLMLVKTTEHSRLPSRANQHLVYVDYLEVAPWNRSGKERRSFKGVGTSLIAAAIQLGVTRLPRVVAG